MRLRYGSTGWARARLFLRLLTDFARREAANVAVQLDPIRAAAQRVAASHGLDLVDVEFAGSGKNRALRIYVEKDAAGREALKQAALLDTSQGLPSGVPVEALSGVTHEDCALFAQDFGTLIDIEDLVPGTAEYVLEVSSPGIERALRTAQDWQRFQGFLVTAKLFTAVNGAKLLTGRMTFHDGTVTLDLSAAKVKGKRKKGVAIEPEVVELSMRDIEKAHLVAEF